MIFLFELSALSFELVSKFKDKHLRSKSKYIAQGGNLCWRWDIGVDTKEGVMSKTHNPLKGMAELTGLEPAASGVTGHRKAHVAVKMRIRLHENVLF
jgi:hypothetical protein